MTKLSKISGITDIFKQQDTKDKSETESENKSKTLRQNNRGRNLNLVISIILAVALWMYVLGEVNPDVPVDLRNIPVQLQGEESLLTSSLILVQGQEFSTNVRVRVKRSNKPKITESQITATADITDLRHGENYVPINIEVPEFATLDQAQPANIIVMVEGIVEVTKLVSITYEGLANEGFEAEVVSFEPSKVKIKGPESVIAKVNRVSGVLDVSKITEDSLVRLNISPLDESGDYVKGLTMDNNMISAKVEMLPVKEVEFKVAMTPEHVDGLSITVKDYPDKIKIKGRLGLINGISVIQSKPVDVSELTEAKLIKLVPDLPVGVYLARSNEAITGNFEVREIESKELTYTSEDIAVNGLDESLKYVISDTQIVVEVKGSAEELDALSQGAIKLYVDATGLDEGEYPLELKYDAGMLNDVTVMPKDIIITITK